MTQKEKDVCEEFIRNKTQSEPISIDIGVNSNIPDGLGDVMFGKSVRHVGVCS